MNEEELVDFIDNLVKKRIEEYAPPPTIAMPPKITPDITRMIIENLHFEVRHRGGYGPDGDITEVIIADEYSGYSKVFPIRTRQGQGIPF